MKSPPNAATILTNRAGLVGSGAAGAILNRSAPKLASEANEDLHQLQAVGKPRRLEVETPRRRFQRMTRERSALDHIGQLPEIGGELLLAVTGTYHGWDLLQAVRTLADCQLDTLHLATLGFNAKQITSLTDLIDSGGVRRVVFLVASFEANMHPAEFGFLHDELTRRGQVIRHTHNHAKLFCLKFTDGRVYSMHGSLNLRCCHGLEQVALTPNPAVYEFLTQWIEDVCQNAETTTKKGGKATGPQAK